MRYRQPLVVQVIAYHHRFTDDLVTHASITAHLRSRGLASDPLRPPRCGLELIELAGDRQAVHPFQRLTPGEKHFLHQPRDVLSMYEDHIRLVEPRKAYVLLESEFSSLFTRRAMFEDLRRRGMLSGFDWLVYGSHRLKRRAKDQHPALGSVLTESDLLERERLRAFKHLDAGPSSR